MSSPQQLIEMTSRRRKDFCYSSKVVLHPTSVTVSVLLKTPDSRKDGQAAGPTVWPPRSPDITLLNYFHVQNLVYAVKIRETDRFYSSCNVNHTCHVDKYVERNLIWIRYLEGRKRLSYSGLLMFKRNFAMLPVFYVLIVLICNCLYKQQFVKTREFFFGQLVCVCDMAILCYLYFKIIFNFIIQLLFHSLLKPGLA